MTRVEAEVRFSVPTNKWGVIYARRRVSQLLTCLNLPGCAQDTEPLLTELVNNAVEHTGTGPTVRLLVGEAVRIEVGDPDPKPVEFTEPSGDPERGWGLAMVADEADRHGCVVEPAGKRVWFELDRGRG